MENSPQIEVVDASPGAQHRRTTQQGRMKMTTHDEHAQMDALTDAAHRRYRLERPDGPVPDPSRTVICGAAGETWRPTFVVLSRIDGSKVNHLAVYRVDSDQLAQATDEEFEEACQGAQW
jgi:hypothetical protein